MCQYSASDVQQSRAAAGERWCRRLTLCLIGGLMFAFAVLPDYLAAADNSTRQLAVSEPARAQSDKFKWKFIVCFPMPVDVLPAYSADRRQLGGAGLVSTLGGLTVNGLFASQ